MSLSDRVADHTRARVLILDIETQRAVVETFSIWKPFIHIDRVLVPSRVLCFAAKWWGDDQIVFRAAWKDGDEEAYLKMLRAAWKLLSEADVVVTWNGDRFDNQWLNSEFGRLRFKRPVPYKSLDLIKINKKHFRGGQMSMKLDWSARQWLEDRKVPHGGTDLWHDIRHGTAPERSAAQKLMREYNIHDTILTEQMFVEYLPWSGLNLALYNDDDGLSHCTKCNGTSLKRESKLYRTNAFAYHLFTCKDCGAPSRGKRYKISTELRAV